MGIFNHNQRIESVQNPYETDLQNMEREYNELSREKDILSAKARTTDFYPDKKNIQEQEARKYEKMSELKTRIETLKEETAKQKLPSFIRENRNDIIIKIEDIRLKIPESLEIELSFSCGHKLKIPVQDIFKYQTQIQNNVQLLGFWERTIQNHDSYTRILTCQECKKEHKTHFDNFRTTTNKRSGTLRLSIEVI